MLELKPFCVVTWTYYNNLVPSIWAHCMLQKLLLVIVVKPAPDVICEHMPPLCVVASIVGDFLELLVGAVGNIVQHLGDNESARLMITVSSHAEIVLQGLGCTNYIKHEVVTCKNPTAIASWLSQEGTKCGAQR